MKKVILLLFFLLLVSGCGFKPSDEDIVSRNSPGITNYNTFLKFVENVEQGREDEIRIVTYMTERDPILSDLEFNGGTITYTRDTSRADSKGGINDTVACKSIEVEDTIYNTTVYYVDECEETNLSTKILEVWN